VYYNLGNALETEDRRDEAVAAYRINSAEARDLAGRGHFDADERIGAR